MCELGRFRSRSVPVVIQNTSPMNNAATPRRTRFVLSFSKTKRGYVRHHLHPVRKSRKFGGLLNVRECEERKVRFCVTMIGFRVAVVALGNFRGPQIRETSHCELSNRLQLALNAACQSADHPWQLPLCLGSGTLQYARPAIVN